MTKTPTIAELQAKIALLESAQAASNAASCQIMKNGKLRIRSNGAQVDVNAAQFALVLENRGPALAVLKRQVAAPVRDEVREGRNGDSYTVYLAGDCVIHANQQVAQRAVDWIKAAKS
jgi:hypothetical protein